MCTILLIKELLEKIIAELLRDMLHYNSLSPKERKDLLSKINTFSNVVSRIAKAAKDLEGSIDEEAILQFINKIKTHETKVTQKKHKNNGNQPSLFDDVS